MIKQKFKTLKNTRVGVSTDVFASNKLLYIQVKNSAENSTCFLHAENTLVHTTSLSIPSHPVTA